MTNPVGAAFVRWYYRHSPKYAAIIAQNETLRTITRSVLMPVYGIAYITLKIGMWFWIFVVVGILSIVATKKGGKWLKRVF